MAHPFVPTIEQCAFVEEQAGLGIGQRQIAARVVNPNTGKAISVVTLAAHFADELERGAALINTKVAKNLFRIATSEEISGPVVTACIFWAKTRMGWREVQRMEHTGADGIPLIHDAVDQFKRRIDRLAGRFVEDDDEHSVN